MTKCDYFTGMFSHAPETRQAQGEEMLAHMIEMDLVATHEAGLPSRCTHSASAAGAFPSRSVMQKKTARSGAPTQASHTRERTVADGFLAASSEVSLTNRFSPMASP
jgi:hypothetical protein